jgi:hypothetical protein
MTKHSGNDDFSFLNNLCRFSVLTHIAQTWGIKLPKHIKMNIDIDTYEIDLNSEKPTPNQYEMNKLEGNQKSRKSIFDVICRRITFA